MQTTLSLTDTVQSPLGVAPVALGGREGILEFVHVPEHSRSQNHNGGASFDTQYLRDS